MLSAIASSSRSSTSMVSMRSFATQAICNPRVSANRERLIILGSGWGGYQLAAKVDRKKYDVTVISPTGYFTFTPLLASTSVGTLEFRTALEPVRRLKNCNFSLARAQTIDLKAQTLTLLSAVPNPTDRNFSMSNPPRAAGAPPETELTTKPLPKEETFTMAYDKLVVAVGAYSATFGTKGVYEHAHFLKDVRDARAIRKRILDCFERASQPFVKEKEKRDLLSFRIVGGGPTGVEFAGELCELIATDMKRIYPDLAQLSTINLYDVAPGILLAFEESLRDYATKQFAREGVSIHPNSRVLSVGDGWMDIEGEGKLPFGLLVWSTGLQPNPLIDSITGVSKDPRSRSLLTDDHHRVLDSEGAPLPNVFAVGDNSIIKDGPRLPPTAQVATQKAHHLARNLNALVSSKAEDAFEFKSAGSMVSLGQMKAMVDRTGPDVKGIKGKEAGAAAWVLWRSAYWGMTMSARNRFLLLVYWGINFITGRDISRF